MYIISYFCSLLEMQGNFEVKTKDSNNSSFNKRLLIMITTIFNNIKVLIKNKNKRSKTLNIIIATKSIRS